MPLLQSRIKSGVLADLAREAMIREVDLSPKPGLVDSIDNGAHRDMDRNLFHLSAAAIRPFFAEMAEITPLNVPSAEVLPVLRPIGIKAEQAMYEATGGINTHKGQIFTLGVTLAAAVRILNMGRQDSRTGSDILMEAGRICQGITRELENTGTSGRFTHGERVYRKMKITGIRGEAEAGYPCVRLTALPRLRELKSRGVPSDLAGLEVLIRLYETTEDSTVLHRRGRTGLNLMQATARNFISSGGMNKTGALADLTAMNRLFIQENISPGGCADLLALTLFVNSLEETAGAGENE